MRFPTICALFLSGVVAAGQRQALPPNFGQAFDFEIEQGEGFPRGWGGGPAGTIFVERNVVHAGRYAARIERTAQSANEFSTLSMGLPVDFAGQRLEWRGYLKTEEVSGYTGLWLREDGDTPGLQFDNMQRQQIKGTREWTAFSITLPLDPRARQLAFGVLVAGTGKVWADDLELLVDGKPVWEAPVAERLITVLDRDHEFDNGSRIAVSSTALTAVQIENLANLARVWGFLKYHHPEVVAGKHHWDYELFRVLPGVLAASTREQSNQAVVEWVRGIGAVPACTTCIASPDGDLSRAPDLEWIRDEDRLGAPLSAMLNSIHSQRSSRTQFYLTMAPNVGNPVFQNEPGYSVLRLPDAGYQLLALFRYWNIIEYWYPNRDIFDEDWEAVLKEFIPRFVRASSRDDYQLEMLALISRITDTHANLNIPMALRPPAGACQAPVVLRPVEDRMVVGGFWDNTSATSSPFKIGDVIETVNGTKVGVLVEQLSPHYSASNETTRLRDIARYLLKGPCGALQVSVLRDGRTIDVAAERVALTAAVAAGMTHDRTGGAFQILPENIAYLKLSAVRAGALPEQIRQASTTRGLIVDIRNYPSEFVVFALGSLLVEQSTAFARFTTGVLEHPGAFRWTAPVQLPPQQPHFAGRVVILVDETSISQAEYTAMALRSSPRALVVGSTTAGADGNVSPIPLPGGLSTAISGIGVFYPDKTPTQRVGILPDVDVRPTIEGLKAGRDEVLEEAIRQILAPQFR